MPINIDPITALPTPPTKADPANFAERADDFLGALPGFAAETNAVITEINKITSGLDQATPIAAWAAGTTYNFPDVVAGSDGYSYRCVGTGVVGVNPVNDDGSNWLNLTSDTTKAPLSSPALTGNPTAPTQAAGDNSTRLATTAFVKVNSIPIGAVVPFIGGYFTGNTNTGFTNVIGNTAAAVNSLVNSTGWYVCNGAALNLAGSPIFNGSGRYLPNLTDDRFIMGDTAAGVIGGDNAMAHTHTTDIASFTSGATTLTTAQMPSHNHPSSASPSPLSSISCGAGTKEPSNRGSETGSTGGGGSHTHSVNPPSTTSSAASNTENRPKFLSAIYIMKVA